MITKSKGFTLIELLVVIAIIGILSAVVLASLGTARQKGSDASAKAGLLGVKAQAELFYYANGNSYTNVCQSNPVAGIKSIYVQVVGSANAEGLNSVNNVFTTTGTNAIATCHDSTTQWAAEVPLKAGGMFCVDYTGLSTTTANSTVGASDTTCGP